MKDFPELPILNHNVSYNARNIVIKFNDGPARNQFIKRAYGDHAEIYEKYHLPLPSLPKSDTSHTIIFIPNVDITVQHHEILAQLPKTAVLYHYPIRSDAIRRTWYVKYSNPQTAIDSHNVSLKIHDHPATLRMLLHTKPYVCAKCHIILPRRARHDCTPRCKTCDDDECTDLDSRDCAKTKHCRSCSTSGHDDHHRYYEFSNCSSYKKVRAQLRRDILDSCRAVGFIAPPPPVVNAWNDVPMDSLAQELETKLEAKLTAIVDKKIQGLTREVANHRKVITHNFEMVTKLQSAQLDTAQDIYKILKAKATSIDDRNKLQTRIRNIQKQLQATRTARLSSDMELTFASSKRARESRSPSVTTRASARPGIEAHFPRME